MQLFTKYFLLTSLLGTTLIFSGKLAAQTPAPTSGSTMTNKAEGMAKSASSKMDSATMAVSDKDIADAKAKGMVWANTKSKVYHKDGAMFGKTKHGKFMTEDDAKKAGFKAAKEPMAGKMTTDKTNMKTDMSTTDMKK